MLGIDVREAATRVADEVLLLRDYPEHARAVLVERDDAVARDLPRIAGVVDREPNAVEARDAVVGAEPEVPVACLDERGDGIDRQPVGDRPVLARVGLCRQWPRRTTLRGGRRERGGEGEGECGETGESAAQRARLSHGDDLEQDNVPMK